MKLHPGNRKVQVKSSLAKLKSSPPNLNRKARKAKVHRITEDKSATGHKRLTCVCGAVAVQAPWMMPADWTVTAREFRQRHA